MPGNGTLIIVAGLILAWLGSGLLMLGIFKSQLEGGKVDLPFDGGTYYCKAPLQTWTYNFNTHEWREK